MKANYAAVFMIGFGIGGIMSAALMRQEYARKKKLEKSPMTESQRLRAELIVWLVKAPHLGYTAEQIANYYNEQVAFIDLISHNE